MLDDAPTVGAPHFHKGMVRRPFDVSMRARRAALSPQGSCPGGASEVASPTGKATAPGVCTSNWAHTRIGTPAHPLASAARVRSAVAMYSPMITRSTLRTP